MGKARAPKKEKSADEKAAEAAAKAEKLKGEVETLVRDALRKLGTSDADGLKLHSSKDEDDGLFPAGTGGAVKEALRVVRAGEDSRLAPVAGQAGAELFGLTADGVGAVADVLPPADAARLIDSYARRHPDSLPKLLPTRTRLAGELERHARDQEKLQEEREAERRRTLDALDRHRQLLVGERDAQVASLQRQLKALGASPVDPPPAPSPPVAPPMVDTAEVNRLTDEVAKLKGQLRAAKAAASDQSNVAPEDSQEFVRNVARRLVGVWTEAAEKGNEAARNAMEVAMTNVGAIEPIGEEGDTTAFDPRRHESGGPVDPGVAVVIERPGWVLAEQAGVEYVIQKARVGQGG